MIISLLLPFSLINSFICHLDFSLKRFSLVYFLFLWSVYISLFHVYFSQLWDFYQLRDGLSASSMEDATLIDIMSVLVVWDLMIWCKCSLFTKSIRYYWVSKFPLTAFRNLATCIRTCRNRYWINDILPRLSLFWTCVIWKDWNVVL